MSLRFFFILLAVSFSSLSFAQSTPQQVLRGYVRQIQCSHDELQPWVSAHYLQMSFELKGVPDLIIVSASQVERPAKKSQDVNLFLMCERLTQFSQRGEEVAIVVNGDRLVSIFEGLDSETR